jgi:hypothetical protein
VRYPVLQRTEILASFHSQYESSTFRRKQMKSTLQTGAMIAAAAAAMAFSGAAISATTSIAATDSVHCAGVNSCKGTSECKSATNACKGQNSCKGMGFVTKTAGECMALKGKILTN